MAQDRNIIYSGKLIGNHYMASLMTLLPLTLNYIEGHSLLL